MPPSRIPPSLLVSEEFIIYLYNRLKLVYTIQARAEGGRLQIMIKNKEYATNDFVLPSSYPEGENEC